MSSCFNSFYRATHYRDFKLIQILRKGLLHHSPFLGQEYFDKMERKLGCFIQMIQNKSLRNESTEAPQPFILSKF